MDNLTHTLTGLFLSRAGLNRLTPLATPVLLLAANAPDSDILSAAGGSLTYLHYHRHFTHSLLFAPVMAAIAAGVVWLFRRRSGFRLWPAIGVALIGVASHLLLDLTNAYGVRLLLPFSGYWFRWDLTYIIDPWIWAVLLLSVSGPILARLVSSEIGATSKRTRGRGFAIFALLFLLLYNGGRAVLHARAVNMLDSRIYSGEEPLRVAAIPVALSPFRWRGIAETRDFYHLQDLDLTGLFDPSAGQTYYKGEQTPALAAARATPPFQEMQSFAQYPLWRSMPAAEAENATRVELMDLRFGDPVTPGFVSTAIVDARGKILRSAFQFGAAPSRSR